MIDTGAASLSLRNRLLSLSVCTTGSQTLAPTGTGYSRAAGSFITDGFADGMEFVPAGFTDNTPRVIQTVTALNITTTTANTAQTAGAGRSLAVGLPQGRAFGNREFKPIAGSPYVVVEFVPGTHSLLTATAQNGMATEDGLFVIKWYGLEKLGELGIEKCVDKVKALFTPGTVIGSVRVRSDSSVRSGQILPQGNGWALCQITVPWWALSNNAIAA